MAWGRWLVLLTPFVVVACDGPALSRVTTMEHRPRPLPAAGRCAQPPQVLGNLRSVWTASVEGLNLGTKLVADAHGNTFLAGQAFGRYQIWPAGADAPVTGPAETVVIAFDPDGHLRWKQTLPGLQIRMDLDVDREGTVTVFRETVPRPGASENYVVRFDAAGNMFGRVSLAGVAPYAARLVVDSSGGFMLVDDAVVTAFDASGQERWKRSGERTVIDQVSSGGSGALFVSGRFVDAFDWVSPPLVARGTGGYVAKLGADGAVLGATIFPEQILQALVAAGTRAFVSRVPSDGASADRMGTAYQTVAALEDGGAGTLQPVWSAGVDAAMEDGIARLAPAPDGGVFAAGRGRSGAVDFGLGVLAPEGMLVARWDAAGRPVASGVFHGDVVDIGSLAADGQGNVFVSAVVTGPFDFGAGIVQHPVVDRAEFLAITKMSPEPATVSDRRCASHTPGSLLEGPSIVPPVSLAMSETHLAVATPTDLMLVPLAGGEPRYVAVAQAGIVGVAMNAGVLYWGIVRRFSLDFGSGLDGRIVSLSPEPGATPRVLVDHQDGLEAIAVDDRRLVFSLGLVNKGSSVTLGKLMSVPLAGGTPTVLVSGLVAGARFALVGGETVVAASSDTSRSARILRIAEDGATTLLALTDWQVMGLAVDDATVYLQEFSEADLRWRIRSLPLSGGPATLVGQGAMSQPRPGLVLAGERLAFAHIDDFGAGLMALPKDGGAPVLTLSGFGVVGGLAARGERLAWFQGDDVAWSVLSPSP